MQLPHSQGHKHCTSSSRPAVHEIHCTQLPCRNMLSNGGKWQNLLSQSNMHHRRVGCVSSTSKVNVLLRFADQTPIKQRTVTWFHLLNLLPNWPRMIRSDVHPWSCALQQERVKTRFTLSEDILSFSSTAEFPLFLTLLSVTCLSVYRGLHVAVYCSDDSKTTECWSRRVWKLYICQTEWDGM